MGQFGFERPPGQVASGVGDRCFKAGDGCIDRLPCLGPLGRRQRADRAPDRCDFPASTEKTDAHRLEGGLIFRPSERIAQARGQGGDLVLELSDVPCSKK